MSTTTARPATSRLTKLATLCLLTLFGTIAAAASNPESDPATSMTENDRTAVSAATALTGSWHGTLDAGPAQLRLVFHVDIDDDGALHATLDSPDQGANGIPVASVTREEDRVTFDLAAIGATFAGTLSDDGARIEGSWSQAGHALPLAVEHRTDAARAEDGAGG